MSIFTAPISRILTTKWSRPRYVRWLFNGLLSEWLFSAADVLCRPERAGELLASKSGEHLWAGEWKRSRAHQDLDSLNSQGTRRVAFLDAWHAVLK